MRNILWLLIFLFNAIISLEANDSINNTQQTVILKQEEIQEILSATEPHAYFGPEICSMVEDLPRIHQQIVENNLTGEHINILCERISQGKTTAPVNVIENSLQEAAEYLVHEKMSLSTQELEQLTNNLKNYYTQFESGKYDLDILESDPNNSDSTIHKSHKSKTIKSLDVKRKLRAGCLAVAGDATICKNLIVGGNETVNGDLTVLGKIIGTSSSGSNVSNGCHPGPLTIGTSDATSLTLATNDCTPRLTIDPNGAVSVAAPSAGNALSVTGNAVSTAVVITDPGTAGALALIGNQPSQAGDLILSIDPITGVVRQGPGAATDAILNGCQEGPLTIGTTNATSLTLATNGCTSRLSIDANGGVSIATPAAAEVGLTIDGGGETITAGDLNIVAGNVIMPAATPGASTTVSKGLIELGGANASATNINIFEAATRNMFAGNYGTVPPVSGADNIALGSSANSTLTAANNTVAIGNAATATGTDSIAIGDGANTTLARTIVLGSKDSTSTGVAPTAGALNAISIGSASGTSAGASSSGIASIAIGGSGGTFAGATAAGDRSVAIGVNATSSSATSIALGSASGTIGGNPPTANNTNAIAIGSASGAVAGPIASGVAAIAIGGSGGTFPGASATGNRSIALGINANAVSSGTVAIGSASGTAGGAAPQANNISAIALGSASLTRAGAIASGISAIAIGGADGTSAAVSNFPGAVASGDRSIAIGVNTTANAASTIAIGSAGSTIAGAAATASNINAIAIGSATGGTSGASASGVASVAIGGANGGVAGASASGARSVAIGNGANTAQDDAIILGNPAVTAVRVGIGTSSPAAKLHVVGVSASPVARLDAGAASLASAPVLTNLVAGALVDTLSINGSNQVFRVTSSKRFKENFRSIDDITSKTYNLNPLMFDYKEENGGTKDYLGFIAEEVAEIFPSLVNYDDDGTPRSVKYECFHALAIKEIQNQQQQLKEQDTIIHGQTTLIKNLLILVEQLQTKMDQLEFKKNMSQE